MSTQPRLVDVSHLPDIGIGPKAPIWWGQILMMTVETVLFLNLLGAYLYIRVQFPKWPPPDAPPPDLTLPSIGMIALIASIIPLHISGKGREENNRRKVIFGMVANLLLAAVFLILRAFEFRRLGVLWKTDIYGSFAWSFLGLHTMHTIADMSDTLVMLVIVLTHRFGKKQIQGLELDDLYWYWVVGIWIPFYFLIYIYPRVLLAGWW